MSEMTFQPKSETAEDYDYQRQIECGPDKWYRAVCLKAKHVNAKSSGNPMMQFSFGIDGGAEGGVRCDYRVMKPDQSTPFRTRVFNALGYAALDKTGGKFEMNDFVGLEVLVKPVVGETQYKEKRIEIRDLKPIKGPDEPVRRYKAEPPKDEIEGEGDVPFEVPKS
jgi:hypothetical protein